MSNNQTNTWNLFLDDERYPVDEKDVIARNFDDAVLFVTERGLPDNIRFDHDLGELSKTGYDFAKWLVDYCIDNNISPDFGFTVHSQNPIGKKNISSLLNNFKESTKKGAEAP